MSVLMASLSFSMHLELLNLTSAAKVEKNEATSFSNSLRLLVPA